MTRTKVATVMAMLVLGACGGGSSGSSAGGTFTTSLPGTKALNTLTPAEVTTLCMDFGKAFSGPQAEQGACKATALLLTSLTASLDESATDAQLKTMCMQSYTACLTQGGADGGTDSCMQPGATCTATVAEFSACVKDQQAELAATFAAIPDCNMVTRASLTQDTDGGTPETMTSPACKTLQMKCPDGPATH